jgi:ribosomal protein S2
LMSTDCDVGKIDIPISGNDYLHISVGMILRFLSESINEGGSNNLRRPFGLQGW